LDLELMRYLPLEPADRAAMLAKIGVKTIDELFADVPKDKLLTALPNLPKGKGEIEVERELTKLASRNVAAGSVPFFVGGGAYRHHVPAAVDHLIQRSEFLTSYTPYQPEVAQGTLQSLFEFQTQVALLTGMEVANASMYDGSTACGEAVLMAHRITRRKRAVLSGGLHPHYRSVVETLGRWSGSQVVAMAPDPNGVEDIIALIDDQTSCVVVQYPSAYGNIRDLRPVADATHAKGALLVVAVTEIVALGLLTSPGEMGADIVAAEGQSLGNGLNFGGPYVGLFATRDQYVRQMPGRLAGETVDDEGRRSFVLTLSAREQHIRREKATSNICTNSGLCALAFSIHLTLLGEAGLRQLARANHANAVSLADRLSHVRGVEVVTPAFFNEFTIRVQADAHNTIDALAKKGVMGGVPVSRLEPGRRELRDLIIVASTEVNTDDDRAAYAKALGEVL
jgi:glycine dehydrogenase subunit 1